MDKIYDIAIIGGGPTGIAAAVEAKIAGLDAIILERSDASCAMIREYYKENKRVDKSYNGREDEVSGNIEFFDGTKQTTLDFFDELIEKYDINIVYDRKIDKISKNEETDLFEINLKTDVLRSKSAIVAIGVMGRPRKPTYPIPTAVKKLTGHSLKHCGKNEKILVVGGGDSAVEYVCALAEHNTCALSYRNKELTRPNELNLAILHARVSTGQVELKLNSSIVKVGPQDDKVLVHFGDGTEEAFDKIVYAIGGSAPKDFLFNCGIEVDETGYAILDENFQTNTKGLFVAGDLAAKQGSSIVCGLNHAYSIINFIKK